MTTSLGSVKNIPLLQPSKILLMKLGIICRMISQWRACTLDLSRAFDSLNHEILFHKLQCIGIRGFVLEWVKSFLSNRTQFTIVNKVASSEGFVKFGVPQGSVLGPLLFLIYINDIAKIPDQKFYPRLFADDTNLFVFAKNVNDLKSQCQMTLNSISSWFLANRLTINITKTCYDIYSAQKYFNTK